MLISFVQRLQNRKRDMNYLTKQKSRYESFYFFIRRESCWKSTHYVIVCRVNEEYYKVFPFFICNLHHQNHFTWLSSSKIITKYSNFIFIFICDLHLLYYKHFTWLSSSKSVTKYFHPLNITQLQLFFYNYINWHDFSLLSPEVELVHPVSPGGSVKFLPAV